MKARKEAGRPAKAAAPDFNFRRLPGGRVLLTNDSGASAVVDEAGFRAVAAGRPAGKTAAGLEAKGFVRERMDFEGYAAARASRNTFLNSGPGLHILVTTLRCNHKCLYCQAGAAPAGGNGTDMSRKVARKSVDFALNSTNPGLTIEFQGGEPLLNWATLSDAVVYARRRAKAAGRDLRLALVSNFSLMTEQKARFLLENEVSICTSLDGPADLHDRNRVFAGGDAHALTVRWLKYFSERADRQGPGYRVFKPSALLTVTRASLGRARDIIDEYARLGLGDIFVRPLTPIGYARKLWPEIGYSAADFAKFYRACLDRILELNASGTQLRERHAMIMLQKIAGADPGYLDMRCPCGAAIGQLAYDYNGDLYTCDEGRMVGWEGDKMFRLGSVLKDDYRSVMLAPVSRACAAASNLEAQPRCARCAYKPYCGYALYATTSRRARCGGTWPRATAARSRWECSTRCSACCRSRPRLRY